MQPNYYSHLKRNQERSLLFFLVHCVTMDTEDMLLKLSALEWLSPQSWRLEVSDLFSPKPFGDSHLPPSCPLGDWLGDTLPGIVICVYAYNLGSCKHSPHPPFLLPLCLTEWAVACCNWEYQWDLSTFNEKAPISDCKGTVYYQVHKCCWHIFLISARHIPSLQQLVTTLCTHFILGFSVLHAFYIYNFVVDWTVPC